MSTAHCVFRFSKGVFHVSYDELIEDVHEILGTNICSLPAHQKLELRPIRVWGVELELTRAILYSLPQSPTITCLLETINAYMNGDTKSLLDQKCFSLRTLSTLVPRKYMLHGPVIKLNPAVLDPDVQQFVPKIRQDGILLNRLETNSLEALIHFALMSPETNIAQTIFDCSAALSRSLANITTLARR